MRPARKLLIKIIQKFIGKVFWEAGWSEGLVRSARPVALCLLAPDVDKRAQRGNPCAARKTNGRLSGGSKTLLTFFRFVCLRKREGQIPPAEKSQNQRARKTMTTRGEEIAAAARACVG